MTRKNLLLTTIASALILTGAAGCGSDDDSAPDTGTTPPFAAPAKSDDAGQEGQNKDGNGPASAGDQKENAPDDKISERPGGPNDQGNGGKEKPGNGSGSVNVPPPPVNPDPVK